MARGPVSKNPYTRNIGLGKIKVGPCAPNIAVVTPVLTDEYSLGALTATKVSAPKEFYEYMSGTPKKRDFLEVTKTDFIIESTFLEKSTANLAIANGFAPWDTVPATISAKDSVTTAGTTTGSLAVQDQGGEIAETWMVVFSGAAAGSIIGLNSGTTVHTFSALDAVMEPLNPANSKKYFIIPASFFSGTWAAGDIYWFVTNPRFVGTSAYADPDAGSIAIGYGGAPAEIRVEMDVEYPDGRVITYIQPRSQCKSNFDESQAEGGEGGIAVSFSALSADDSTSAGHANWNANLSAGISDLGRLYKWHK